MDKLKYIKIEKADGSLSDSIPLTADAVNITMANGNSAEDEINSKINENQLNSVKNILQNEIKGIGSPLVASSISEMTDTKRVYVLTTNGHWYYYNDSTWTDGGVYQAAEDSETVNELKEELEEIVNIEVTISKNKIDTSRCMVDYTLDSFGNTSSYNGRSVTDYIKVNKNDIILFTRTNINTGVRIDANCLSIWGYNENKEAVERLGTNINVLTINNENIKYIRACMNATWTDLSLGHQIMMTINDDDTSYKVFTPSSKIVTLKIEPRIESIESKTKDYNFELVGLQVMNPKILSSSWSDFCVINDKLLIFSESDTSVNDYTGYIYVLDIPTKTFEKKFTHDFGHCNSLEYNKDLDAIVMGNGGQNENIDGQIKIYYDVSSWLNLEDGYALQETSLISNSKAIVIDTGDVTDGLGYKVNAIWGDNNEYISGNNLIKQNNTLFVCSNNLRKIYKILLGVGTNQFENGTYVESNLFNGTWKVAEEYTLDYIDVIQGMTFYNGCLYVGLGHDGRWILKIRLQPNSSNATIEQLHKRYYKPDGSNRTSYTEGCTVYKNMLIVGERAGMYRIGTIPLF